MAKRGRPRKGGAREPNGRPQRAGKANAEDKIMEVALEQRARIVGPAVNLKDQKLATPMGVMCVLGKLTEQQHEAGRLYAEGVARYRWSRGIPSPHARSADMSDAPRGGSGAEISPERARYIREAYQDAYRALSDAGRFALLAVNDVAVHEREARPEQVESLILGLDSLVSYYGLTRRRKSA